MSAVRRSVLVRCPQEHAFRVFTERVDEWWPPSHRVLAGARLALEPGVGGRLVERGPGGEERVLGEVVAWDPPRSLSFAWRLGAPSAPTVAAITFAADGPATEVEVIHTEGAAPLPDWPKTSRIYDRAWERVLDALRTYLGGPS